MPKCEADGLQRDSIGPPFCRIQSYNNCHIYQNKWLDVRSLLTTKSRRAKFVRLPLPRSPDPLPASKGKREWGHSFAEKERLVMKKEFILRRSSAVFVGLLAILVKKITAIIALALALALVPVAWGYSFTPIAFLDNPAPGGGNFTFDFEPSALNNSGEVPFTADVTTGGEAVFVGFGGQLTQIARSGQPAPGGGTFGPTEFGRLGVNDGGDIAIPFSLEPFDFNAPVTNGGLFRFSHSTQTLSRVAGPGTPVPGGEHLAAVYFNTAMNNQGDIVFSGIVTGGDIDPNSAPGFMGLGVGLFLADKNGTISNVIRPGDPAPGGHTFDMATNASINNGGDIAFGGHVAGDECINVGNPLFCAESVYLKDAATGRIRSIAHQGDPAPGGGVFRLAFGPVLNSRDDIVFIGDLTPAPATADAVGVFLYSRGTVIAVARPGDPMPGGGTFLRAGFQLTGYDLNQRGDVSFAATLSTDVNNDGLADSGLYVFSKGSIRLVARTGTVIPGLGTIAYLGTSLDIIPSFFGAGAIINERGQVLFFATLSDGRGVLLLATPQ